MPTRIEIVEAARTLVGRPYQHQGRNPRLGMDCIGLVCCTWQLLYDKMPIIPANYTMFPKPQLLLGYVNKHLVKTMRMTLAEFKYGDIVVLLGDRDTPQHFAIVGNFENHKSMIHSYLKLGKVVEMRWGTPWTNRIAGVYEFPDTVD